MKALASTKKLRRFQDGGDVDYGEDEREAPTGMSEATAFVASAESAPKQSFRDAYRNAKDGSTFEWNGKKFKKESAKPSPKTAAEPAPPRPRAEPAPARPRSSPGDEYSGRARLSQMLGSAEARANVKPDIKGDDIVAARRSGDERRARDRENLYTPLKQTLKSIGAKLGSQAMRDRAKTQGGYASGGLVKRGTLKSHGKAC